MATIHNTAGFLNLWLVGDRFSQVPLYCICIILYYISQCCIPYSYCKHEGANLGAI